MNDSAVYTENLSRSFQSVRAVDQLSLEIPRGIVFGFLGPNGSGKTTTIRLLLGLLQPDSGRAEVLGYSTATQADAIRQRCGALLEHTGLYERLTAEDNLEFYGRIAQIPVQERRGRIHELLDSLGLWDRRRETVGAWSRGMKQKLAIARALLSKPELIFLDEPTAGLDPLAAAALRDDLSALSTRHGVTVFLTTHNLTEAEKLCAQVAVIRQGRLLKVGKPDELRQHSGKPHAEIFGSGFTPALLAGLQNRPEVAAVTEVNGHLEVSMNENVEIAPLVTWMVSAGAQIEEIRRGQASLEEVFMTLMEEDGRDR
jgi:ABC-2 type transport system ATP-binding protein